MIYSIIIGLVAGALAKFLMPGKDPGGWIITIILGLAGAVVGNFVAARFNFFAQGWIGDVIFATGGAVLLLVGYRFIKKQS